MIVLDIETTGVNPETNSIVSIGAIDFENPEERFYEECRIWDGSEINPNALLVNGLTEEELKDPNKKTESDIVNNFVDWLSDKKEIIFAGQNPQAVDMPFLSAALKRAGREFVVAKRFVDQHSIAMAHMIKQGITPPIKNNRSDLDSDKIMAYVGLPPEPKPHVAINGALWELEALYRLILDKPLLEEFQNYKIPWL